MQKAVNEYQTNITYDNRKDLPCEGLAALFRAVGWSDGSETAEMIRLCRNECPDSEWLVQTIPERAGFYEQLGFVRYEEPVLQINVINLRMEGISQSLPCAKARRVKQICQWHICSQSGKRQRPGRWRVAPEGLFPRL